jgi:DNA-binding PadR family transcriptional regulator
LTNIHNKEGVLVAKKDYNAPKHEELDVPNLEVIKAMQSLTSKGLVKTRFSWQWYYYTLTPEGVEFLREWCVSPSLTFPSISPSNLKPQAPSPSRNRPRHAQKSRPTTPSRPSPPRRWRRRRRLQGPPRRP